MSRVSVIVPVYNTEKYLEECIESVIAQSVSDWELIIVDDGSTDGSLDIAKKYEASDDRIKAVAISHQRQGGARNEGIRLAEGEYVMLLDSDDILDPQALKKCADMCSENDLDFATFDAEGFLDENDPPEVVPNDVSDRSMIGIESRVYSGREFWKLFNEKKGVSYGPVMQCMKRKFIMENGLLFEQGIYFEDNDWILRLYLAADRIMYIPEKLYRRRYRKGSVLLDVPASDIISSSMTVFEKVASIFMTEDSVDGRDMALSVIEIVNDRIAAIAETDGFDPEKLTDEEVIAIRRFAGTLAQMINEVSGGKYYRDNDPELKASFFDMCWLGLSALSLLTKGTDFDVAHIRRSVIRDWYGLSGAEMRSAIYGAGRISDIFADWYEKSAGPIGERCVFMMTHPDRLYHRERRIYAPGGMPGGAPLNITVAAAEEARREISSVIDGVYGKDQKRVFFHALITEGKLSYGH